MSFYWKARTLISGDYREIERNMIEHRNKKIIKKYKGKKDIYCIFRIYTDEGGLFCLFVKVLKGLQYCAENGFIPVVDTQSHVNIFQTKAERGKLNAWELFFTQPANVSYDEVKNLPNTIIYPNPPGPRMDMPFLDNDNVKAYWREITKRYIHFSPEVKEIIAKHENAFFDGSKTLGILARGTDYKKNVATGHPIQPTVEETIFYAHKAVNEYGCKKIFLATEDQKIFDAITKEFGDMVYSIPQKRFDEEINDKLGHRKDYADFAKEMNRAYLASIYMLSRCNCLVSGQTTGMQGAYYMSSGYEYEHIFFKGSFNLDDDETCDIRSLDTLDNVIKSIH